MRNIFKHLILILSLSSSLWSAYAVQIGTYQSRPSVPPQLQQMGVPIFIDNQDNVFRLLAGPFTNATEAQQANNTYNLSGFIVEVNIPSAQPATPMSSFANNQQAPTPSAQFSQGAPAQVYAVEILSTKDANNVPRRLVLQVFQAGFIPVFIQDAGLYKLIAGPFNSQAQADSANGRLASAFGRSMYTIPIASNVFISAIRPQQPTQAEIGGNVPSTTIDKSNEHLAYLEQQRQSALSKYNIDPYGPTAAAQSNAQHNSTNVLAMTAQTQALNAPSPQTSSSSLISSKGGLVASVGTISSKHEFAVNGVQIEGIFSPGFMLGYKFNDNTIFQLSYHSPEKKATLVNLYDGNTVEVSSSYSSLIGAEMKYRYFLPSLQNLFLSSNFGAHFVQQEINSYVPLNFGHTYNYHAIYTAFATGIGAGYKFTRTLSVAMDYMAYITLKTVTNNVRFHFSYEF